MDSRNQDKFEVTVLLAEDEFHARVFAEMLLKKMVSKVFAVSSGKEGLDIFKKNSIDIVITDIQMPGISGLKMLREMKSQRPNLLSMITTAYGETEYFLEAIELGVDRFLLKPFTEEILFENIQYLSRIVLREEQIQKEEQARRLAEEQLKLSEEKFRLFFEMSPQGILIIDSSSLQIIQANKAASHILGFSVEELQQFSFEQIVENDEFINLKELSELIPYEISLLTKNHHSIPVEIQIKWLGIRGAKVLLILFTDISARKQAEEQIYLYQTKLEDLVEKRTAELRNVIQRLTSEQEQRNQLNKRLERNVEMEKLISSIASKFVNPVWHEIENQISESLQSIADFTGMEQGFFWLFEPNTTNVKYRILSHKSENQYIHRIPQGFDLRVMEHLHTTLTRGNSFKMDDEHPLQPNLEESKYIRLNKIKRLIIYPIEHQNLLRAFIGLDSSLPGKLPEDLEFVLKILGKVFLDAMLHRLNALEIRVTVDKITALLNAMPDMLITVNEDGSILEINENAARILNIKLSLNAPIYFSNLFPVEIASTRWKFVKQVFETGNKRQHIDTYNGRKYEHVFFPIISSNNKVEHVGILIRDITQIYLYQQQLSENYQLLNTIINSIPSPLYYKNTEGRLLGFNDAFLDFTGKESAELLGKRLEDFFPKSFVEFLVQKDEEMLRTRKAQIFEIKLDHPDVKFQHIQVIKSLFGDAEGKPAGIIGVLVDITEIKRINEELKILNENLARRVEEEVQKVEKQRQALIQKSRIESLGQMAAGIAHEINQPLSAIALATENALYKLISGDFEKEYILGKFDIIKQNVFRIKTIIDHVKLFSRPGFQAKFIEIDLNQAVNSALMLLFQQLKNQEIIVDLKLSDSELFVVGDLVKIEQVIINLLHNAWDAIMEKESQSGAFDKKIEISSGIMENKAFLAIADNGIGIPSDVLDKIFEPFFTTKEKRQGTGLGLSIVYSLLNEMKGEIKVKSQPGKGTIFTILMPLVSSPK